MPGKGTKVPSLYIAKINIVNNDLLSIDDRNDKINIQKMKKINYKGQNYLGILLKDNHQLQDKYALWDLICYH